MPHKRPALRSGGRLVEAALLPAGKKRRRHVQQPKPVQKYDLDVGGFEFSSTQKMHDEEPLQSEAPFCWQMILIVSSQCLYALSSLTVPVNSMYQCTKPSVVTRTR